MIAREDRPLTRPSLREMAAGNTFGATALSSYGGFWISFAIILTPGGFAIEETVATNDSAAAFANSFGLYLMVCQFIYLMRLHSNVDELTGLVHIYNFTRLLHLEINRRVLPAILLARSSLFVPGYRLPVQHRRRAERIRHQSRRLLWSDGGLLCVVQCTCRYCRRLEQVCSRNPFVHSKSVL